MGFIIGLIYQVLCTIAEADIVLIGRLVLAHQLKAPIVRDLLAVEIPRVVFISCSPGL